MLVGVNTLGMKPGWGGGEEVYLRNVLVKMSQLQRSTQFVLFTDRANHDSFDGYRRFHLEEGQDLDQAAHAQKVDFLFSSLSAAPVEGSIPLAIYAMGLGHLAKAPGWRRLLGPSPIKIAKDICMRASIIVAPSEFVKEEFLALMAIPLNRVVVAPLGVHDQFAWPQSCIVEKPYLLTVGNTRQNRNIPRLLEVFQRIGQEFPHTLVVVGQPCEAEPDDWGPRVVRIDHLPASQLAGLYQHCALFICPSLYEGSGVRAIEAMKAGTPVATGRAGGITEVVGDSPIFFNPESVDSMVSAVRRALQETDAERGRRIHFGKQTADEYTWEKCAWKTLTAFRRVESARLASAYAGTRRNRKNVHRRP